MMSARCMILIAVSGCSGPGLFSEASHQLLGPRSGHTATRLPNGKVLIAGGIPAEHGPELFSPTTGAFTRARGALDAAVWTATSLQNGQVFLTGNGSVTLFDANDETFTFVPGSDVAVLLNHTCTLLRDGRVLLIGRLGDASVAEIYDPTTRTFRRITGPSLPRTLATATRLDDGRVLLAGGMGPAGAVDVADLFDPATDTFQPTHGTLPTSLYFHTATPLMDGKVLLAGGSAFSGSAATAIFDPSTGDFTPTPGGLLTQRTRHTATRLTDGRVLVAGGLDGAGRGSTTSAELFDPLTGLFEATANPLLSDRVSHAATLLQDGKVLITGGYATRDGSVAGVEFYW